MSIEDGKHMRIDELIAIIDWAYENDLSKLDEVIRNGNLSPAMSEFVADIVTGKRKRKKGAKSTAVRDEQLFSEVDKLLLDGHKLTSSKNKDGAAEIVAQNNGLTEDVVIKSCQRMKAKYEPAISMFIERFKQKFMEDE